LLHIHLYLHVAFPRRTKDRNLPKSSALSAIGELCTGKCVVFSAFKRPCNCSVGQSPPLTRKALVPIPGPSVWNLWWTKLTVRQALSQYLGFPLSLSPHQCSINTLTHMPTLLRLKIPMDTTFRRLTL
jgi:hypothetical protein